MRTAGFEFQKAEVRDVSTLFQRTSLTGSRMHKTVKLKSSRRDVTEIVANLPDILTIGAAYMSGGATAAHGVCR